MSENVTSLVVPEGDGGGGGGGRSLPNLIRHLGEFIRCALHRNGSPRPHPQPLPGAVYIARQKEAIFSDADQPQNIFVITLFIIKNTIIIIIIRSFSLRSLLNQQEGKNLKVHLENVCFQRGAIQHDCLDFLQPSLTMECHVSYNIIFFIFLITWYHRHRHHH